RSCFVSIDSSEPISRSVLVASLNAAYTKWRPSGRNDGRRSLGCNRLVTGVVTPPLAGTLSSGLPTWGEETITPVGLQAPASGNAGWARTGGEPPLISIRRSWPRAKNASERPSGDQKGPLAPSVSTSGLAVTEPSGRIQIRCVPSVAAATNASCRPSGDM